MAMMLTETVSGKLIESSTQGDITKISGPFFMAETKNRNGRIYPKVIMEKAIEKYMDEYVNEGIAIGELNHPDDRIYPDPAVAALLINKLWWEDNLVMGEATIIDSPQGHQIKALLKAGYRLGVSSRAVGSVVNESRGSVVQSDLEFHAVDAVHKPSAQVAYVHGLCESTGWEKSESGVWVKSHRHTEPSEVEILSENLKKWATD